PGAGWCVSRCARCASPAPMRSRPRRPRVGMAARSERARRQPTLLAVASAAWLIVISALVLIDYVAWSNRTDPELLDARMALFEGRLDALDERFEDARRQPPGVETARYEHE